MGVNLEPSEIAQAFARVLADGVRCVSQDDELRLDTLYVLQDGRLLQVFLSVVPGNGHIVVSDGAVRGPAGRDHELARRAAVTLWGPDNAKLVPSVKVADEIERLLAA